ncbi:nucleotide exchange factor GrpE [Pseudomonadota bacterium]
MEQTLNQFLQTLERIGFKQIKAEGETFDPNLHEALLTAPGEKDLVLEELEKGFTLNDRVVKQAKVKVGSGESTSGS